jgi:hypothetical protein
VATPRVTIGMTLYNVERYLPLALDSVLAQDYPDFEIVACDNASTDRTWEIVSDRAARDSRLRIYRNESNLGMSANFRRVVELARGELFHLHAHDDLAAPGLLTACVAALDAAGPEAVVAYPLTRLIDGDGRELCSWRDPVELRSSRAWQRVGHWAARSNLCNELFGVVRTSALRRTHLQSDRVVSPDVVMLTELAALGRFVEVPQELFFRRMHAGGTHQGERTVEQIAAFLEPNVPRRRTRRFALTRETVGALWDSDRGFPTRISTTLAFLARHSTRRIRGRVRRYSERILRVPPRPIPWEVASATEGATPSSAT